MDPQEPPQESESEQPARVGELAELYLGNILECTALGLVADGKLEDAAFYRGIGRALAEAHGKWDTRSG
jgi:hypothetical protein